MASFTQDQLDSLEAAIAEGVLVVEYKDKKVQYRSVDEMLKIRELMREALGKNGSTGAGSFYPEFRKG